MSGQLGQVVSIPADVAGVLGELVEERARQDAKWGEQNHPDGTGGSFWKHTAAAHRWTCQQAAQDGTVTWLDILREETSEAFAENDPARLRAELVQVAAVCVQWVQAIDRRQP